MNPDPRITVSGEHHRGMGTTVILSASNVNRVALRKAGELVRYTGVYAPYVHQAADGAVVIGTSEAPRDEATQTSDLYAAPAQRTRSQWVCMVQHSGFHNGPPCTEADQHPKTWRCGWYFHVMVQAPGPGVFADLPGTHPDHS